MHISSAVNSMLRKSTWNGIGIDADNRAFFTGTVVDIDPIPSWASDLYPQVVQWVSEYMWTGKTMAQNGYDWDAAAQNFGPPLPVGDSQDSADILELVDLSDCDSPCYSVDLTIDESTEGACMSNGDSITATAVGACVIEVTVEEVGAITVAGWVAMPCYAWSFSDIVFIVTHPISGGLSKDCYKDR